MPRYEIVQERGVWYVMKGERIAHSFTSKAEAARWVRQMRGGR